KQGTHNYFMKNILPSMNVDNARSLKFRENNEYLQSLEIIYWGNMGPSNCVNEKKFIIRAIFNNDCYPLLKFFIISTTGSDQGGYTIPSLMATTKTTNIQNLSVDTLTFDDLFKLLPAMQNVKSFRIDYKLCYDDRSNIQHESMIIYKPLVTHCISLYMKLIRF
ncbi:unnamed protein product, partial [Rotaria socialis]